MTSAPGYCIPRGITFQKLFIFTYFLLQKQPKRGVNSRLHSSGQTRKKYSNFCIIKTTNTIATKFCSDKDRQILVVGRRKICPTNPKWRTAAILNKKFCYGRASEGLHDALVSIKKLAIDELWRMESAV